MNITGSDSDGFYCEQVSFSNAPFQSGTTVKVFTSLSHEDNPDNVNEASVAMVTSVDYSSFNVCTMEPSQPSGKLTLNWLAFGDNSLPQGVLSGSVPFNVFTSGSSCSVVTFSLVSSDFEKKNSIIESYLYIKYNIYIVSLHYTFVNINVNVDFDFRICCLHNLLLNPSLQSLELSRLFKFIQIFLSLSQFSRSLIHPKFFSAFATTGTRNVRMPCPCGQKM